MQKLKKHCLSCHDGGNKVEFLADESDLKNWMRISTTKNDKGTLWVTAVIESLSWPSSTPPNNYDKAENGRIYMPLGGKKEAIAKRPLFSRRSDREYIVDELQRMMDCKKH